MASFKVRVPSRTGITFAPSCSIQKTLGRWRATSSDRKSTRLNSSHGYISYAVFCLKKKKKIIRNVQRITEITQSRHIKNISIQRNVIDSWEMQTSHTKRSVEECCGESTTSYEFSAL